MNLTLKPDRTLSLLPNVFNPLSTDSLLKGASDVASTRARFLRDRFPNLEFLLRERHEWMNPYLVGLQNVVEVGSGAGFAKMFISNPNLKLTDVLTNAWIDSTVDALELPYREHTVDAILCNQALHHFSSPARFMCEATRVLRPGGLLLIQEPYASVLLKLILLATRKEGWSYDVDVFDKTLQLNGVKDPVKDPWEGNNAIPQLLFSDHRKFEAVFPDLKVEFYQKTECLIFPLSGGVTATIKMIPLPRFVLQGIKIVDRVLIAIMPELLALGIRVVIRKR